MRLRKTKIMMQRANSTRGLENAYDLLPGNTVKIIVGDFNAQIGREPHYRPTIGKESLHIASNDNGIRVINFAVSKHLVVSSTFFPRKDIYKQTWVSPNTVNKSQIDHIIIEKRHKSSISNVRSYRGADGDTDHYLPCSYRFFRATVS